MIKTVIFFFWTFDFFFFFEAEINPEIGSSLTGKMLHLVKREASDFKFFRFNLYDRQKLFNFAVFSKLNCELSA